MRRAGPMMVMLGLTLAACASRDSGPPTPGGEPPLSALITREEQVVRADGVTQSTRYQERLVRADGHAWVARVLDPRVAPPHEHRASRRDVHDWSVVPRLVTHGQDKGVRLQFVLSDERELVDVPPPEFDSVGFFPDWGEVAHLLGEDVLARLQPVQRPGAPEGARWLEASAGETYLRVLWSDRLSLALEVESGRKDGTVVRRMRADVHEPAPRVPWEGLHGFQLKDVNDYRD